MIWDTLLPPVISCPPKDIGGLAPVVIEQCETVTHYEPDLTLHGLRMIFDRNA